MKMRSEDSCVICSDSVINPESFDFNNDMARLRYWIGNVLNHQLLRAAVLANDNCSHERFAPELFASLDADCIRRMHLHSELSIQEVENGGGNLHRVRFEREVACVVEMYFRIRVIASECLGAVRQKEWIVFAPDSQQSRTL